MPLVKGDIPGIVTFVLIAVVVSFVIYQFSFLPLWARGFLFLWFLLWFGKTIGVVFSANF
ncbi:MAG: hypothetical protein WBJ22_00700 [Minisyncoccales bacterium]